MTLATLLAHGSGVDEIALIIAPLLIVGGLLFAANRWAAKRADTDE